MPIQELKVPNLDGAENVAIVEIFVQIGDSIELDTPVISLESDKAVIDVPSDLTGIITELKVAEGDTVNEGDVIAYVDVAAFQTAKPEPEPAVEPAAQDTGLPAAKKPEASVPETPPSVPAAPRPVNQQPTGSKYHATPSVRGFARELGVDLSRVTGSGPKGRITQDDVMNLVKSVMKTGSPAGSAFHDLPPIPGGDHGMFGEIETQAISRIKKISGPHLHRNWLGIPHVTQFEEADITDLENFRKSLNEEGAKRGETKVSPLIFILKSVVPTLKAFPDFNSSLNPDGAALTHKKYYNIGIAVDTPDGLVVPVLKAVDTKGIRTLARELADLSSRARDGKLKPDEMQGSTFTISSLGGIGGTGFTPIINAPETAILGLSKSAMKPVWNGTEFIPRLILPFSVSYDHRVIDGAQAARFAVFLASMINDIRRSLL
ncbi:MAG: hypothetical protein B6D68_03035 [spirochete symbiont of Stewartia floridana]|nr:MAG: hypothetical protein B6D68_03035 [spirochete symbiont of Stewartia floridana]